MANKESIMRNGCFWVGGLPSSKWAFSALGAALMVAGTPALAESEEALAQKLANPVAALISMPMQFNYDRDIGRANGNRSVLNIQPVVPFSVDSDWNLISRTILPIVAQERIAGESGSQTGIGDVSQSLFLSPAKPSEQGVIWGVGGVFLLPTASETLLGGGKWGVGPTGVVLVQRGSWTLGALANHVWSVAGDGDRPGISATFLQPFVSYITPGKTTFSVNTEATYDWKQNQWSVPVHFSVSQLLSIGNQPVQLGMGARYWAASPEQGANGWGFRASVTFLFPK